MSTPTTPILRVAVLGAGTMGARIAAQLANAGIASLMLDVDAERARGGLETALKSRPPAFYVPAGARLIETGSFERDLNRVSDCEWVIEAVSESLEVKRHLYDSLLPHRTPRTIVSTNTSGIPLHQLAAGYPPEFRERFLGTHFFNPPRYLHLAELIPGPDTLPGVLARVSEFCDLRLGKGVVRCKDTPNFIANRIGAFLTANVQRLTVAHDLTIDEVDALTGKLIGFPKSASYRLLDVVGLDIWAQVAANLGDGFAMQPFAMEMIARGWLGDKAGLGFYRRVGREREIHAIDWKTLEYHPPATPRFESTERLRRIEPLPARLKALVGMADPIGRFLWQILSDHLLYAASVVPEISNRIVEIDRAMRWGYAHTLGPFELWDALGFEATARRMEAEGRVMPESVMKMLSAGAASFYRAADREGCPRTEYFDVQRLVYLEIERRPGIVSLAEWKRARGAIYSNAAASLIDLEDGVICCEFHNKMNAVGEDVMQMVHAGLEELDRNFVAMVIGNQGDVFSAGANLKEILLRAQEGKWDELDAMIRRFQQMNMSLKYAAKPVVAAPFGMTLGGGCEVCLHCAGVQASAELYMGLVEVGVGLIPAGGGCKEMLLRVSDATSIYDQIGFAKVSTSAEEARAFGYVRDGDGISINPERLLDDARSFALSLVAGYSPGHPRNEISVRREVDGAHQGWCASEYDLVIARRLAHVLSGGGRPIVSEQDLLDLEREAFLSLCGAVQTRQRIEHMLKTGKPLRN